MLGDDAKKLTAMSSSGHWFAFPASDGQQVLLADLWSSPPALNRKTLLGNTSPIDVIVFGGHDQWIAAACKDRIVRVWDLRTGSDDTRPLLLQPSKWPIEQLSVSDDGRWLAVISNGGEAGEYEPPQLYDLRIPGTGKRTLLEGHTNWVMDGVFSHNSRWLLTTSGDETARLWDLSASDPSAHCTVLKGHGTTVLGALFDKQDHLLVTGGWDSAGRRTAAPHLWNLGSAHPEHQRSSSKRRRHVI